MPTLNAIYWENRYQHGNTNWDIGSASMPLANYFKQITDKDIAIMMPGCGNAYEAEFLTSAGFTNITLIDIAESPVNEAKLKFAEAINKGNVKVLCEDFFDHTGAYDLIIEQTFFCAIHPSMRPEYAKKMNTLIKPKGKLAGLLFDFPLTEDNPPYGGSIETYKEYFSPYFNIIKIEKCYNSIKPREGRELFFILQKPN